MSLRALKRIWNLREAAKGKLKEDDTDDKKDDSLDGLSNKDLKDIVRRLKALEDKSIDEDDDAPSKSKDKKDDAKDDKKDDKKKSDKSDDKKPPFAKKSKSKDDDDEEDDAPSKKDSKPKSKSKDDDKADKKPAKKSSDKDDDDDAKDDKKKSPFGKKESSDKSSDKDDKKKSPFGKKESSDKSSDKDDDKDDKKDGKKTPAKKDSKDSDKGDDDDEKSDSKKADEKKPEPPKDSKGQKPSTGKDSGNIAVDEPPDTTKVKIVIDPPKKLRPESRTLKFKTFIREHDLRESVTMTWKHTRTGQPVTRVFDTMGQAMLQAALIRTVYQNHAVYINGKLLESTGDYKNVYGSMSSRVNQCNRVLSDMGRKYYPHIPVNEIFAVLKKSGFEATQEDGTPWSGMFLGRDGRAVIDLRDMASGEMTRKTLAMQWHKMDVSGNYEVTAYVS